MFTFIKSIRDINCQINHAPLYYSRVLNINGKEYWLQYLHMSLRETTHYEVSGEKMGIAAVQLIKNEDNGLYSVYKYNGTLFINRHLEKNVIEDTIENLQELETEIAKFFV